MNAIGSTEVVPPGRMRFGFHNVRIGFRMWRRSRPFWASVIAAVGAIPMWYLPSRAVQFLFVSKTPIWLGMLVGVLVEFFALMLLFNPAQRTMYGMFVVLFSLVSFITSDFGGLFIGMLLGILGGSLALAWAPVMGKTKRQQKWLMKTRGEKPVVVAAAVATEVPDHVIVLDEPVSVTETVTEPETVETEQMPVGEISEIDVFAWEVPPIDITEGGPVIDVTETAAEPVIDATEPEIPEATGTEGSSEATSEIDIRDMTIDVREGTSTVDGGDDSSIVDLREEKAITAPPVDEGNERPDRSE